MRAFVTGASGFLGARVVDRLVAAGMQVRALVRRGLLIGRGKQGCERVRGDVTDPDSLRRAMDSCDIVFHCAWGGTSLAEGRRINVEGTRNVLQCAATVGVRRVVHLSSMAVHGRALPAELGEEQPLRIRGDAYGVTKAEGEVTAFERGRALGIEVVALRPTLIYGPGAPLWVLGYFERVRQEQVALIDGGSGLANLVYVDDVVDAMRAAATQPGVAGEAFLISGPHPVTWREYIGHFARMCGKPLPPSVPLWKARIEVHWLRVYGTLAGRPRRLRAMDVQLMAARTAVRTTKARRMLDFAPQISLADGMDRCEVWLRREGYLPPVFIGIDRDSRDRVAPPENRAAAIA